MERVAFLVEDTGERIPCLLNPDSLVVRRSAAVRRATSAGGALTGTGLADDPVIATGGGRTELELDLLFDTSLLDNGTEAERPMTDVRDLTRPMWQLAENAAAGGTGAFAGPPLVRFVWGKAWNVLGVVAAVAERVEQFGADGSPNRSWLRLRLLRVGDPAPPADTTAVPPPAIAAAAQAALAEAPTAATATTSYEVVGDERTDVIAARVYGRPWLWRLIAEANPAGDPPLVAPGTILRIPPVPPFDEALPDGAVAR